MIHMAQYLLSVLTDRPDPTADDAERAAIDVFNEQMQRDGNWVFAGGLGLPHTATVIDARRGDAVLTDGPFAETKEFVAGLWIIQAANLDAALRLATQGSQACNRRVEVRPIFGADD
jgi:hypothetical protein